LYMQIFSRLDKSHPSLDSHQFSGILVNALTSTAGSELLQCRRLLVPLLQANTDIAAEDSAKLLEHLAIEYLESYQFERCEVALSFCLETMTPLAVLWTRSQYEELFDNGLQIYEWFVKKALTAGVLSSAVQKRLCDLLETLMGLDADYGVAENLPSVRTTLFLMLKQGKIVIKDHVAAAIPKMLNLFVLAKHDDVFSDVLSNLPDNQEWSEGIAMRLLVFARLGLEWYTLRRRCVFHILETAGALPVYTSHAKACIKMVSEALGLDNPRTLFRVFSRQLLFTWLSTEYGSMENIPFNIFAYPSLEALMADNQEEACAQIIMRQKAGLLSFLASKLAVSPEELIARSFGKTMAYCLVFDLTNQSANSEKYLRSRIPKDQFHSLISASFVRIEAEVLLSIDRESDIGKYLQKRPELGSAFESLNEMKRNSSSDSILPHGQQPLLQRRYFLDCIERLRNRVNCDVSELWTCPSIAYVIRVLIDAMHPALGPLHACSVIRKIRIVVCMAGPSALQGYPLEMLLQALRPFLTNHHCADDAFGIVQYLFAHGRSALVERPRFLGSISLLILISLRDFLASAHESTTQESQHLATMDKAYRFHVWFSSYLRTLPLDALSDTLHTPFQAILRSAGELRQSGSVTKDAAETELLRELLDDEERHDSLIDRPSRDAAFSMLCGIFTLPKSTSEDPMAADSESHRYSVSLLQVCRRVTVSADFLSWASKALGRTFASQGFVESAKSDHDLYLQTIEHSDSAFSNSRTAIIALLLECFQSNEQGHVSHAEKTLRTMYQRYQKFRTQEEMIAFEQLIPSHIDEALKHTSCDSDTVSPNTDDQTRSQKTLQLASLLPPGSPDHDWTQSLTILLSNAVGSDALLGALPLVLTHIGSLAEAMFPYVLHEVLLSERGANERIKKDISGFYEQWLCQVSPQTKTYIQVLLRGILYLRTQSLPNEPNIAVRDQWLDVDFQQAARAASCAEMYSTALLFVEMSSSNERGRSRRSSLAPQPVPGDLLLDIYTRIGDPDAFYGVDQTPNLETTMLRAEHESNGFKSLLYRGARLDSQMRQGLEPDSQDYLAIIQAMNQLNVNSVTQSMVSNLKTTNIDKSTAGSLLETARKLEQWDVRPPDTTESEQTILFKAFQTLNVGGRKSMILTNMNAALAKCMDNIVSGATTSASMQSNLRVIAALTEVDEILRIGEGYTYQDQWATMKSRHHWMELGQ
jgi:serine-protein kinase ATM